MEEIQKTPTVLARYKSHKIVEAAKIIQVAPESDGTDRIPRATLHFEAGTIVVDHEYLAKHNPHPGGYYVKYSDDYASWSPAAQFEKGYTLVDDSPAKACVQDFGWAIQMLKAGNASAAPAGTARGCGWRCRLAWSTCRPHRSGPGPITTTLHRRVVRRRCCLASR